MADIKLSQGIIFFKEKRDTIREIHQTIDILRTRLDVIHAQALQGNYLIPELNTVVQEMRMIQDQGLFLMQNIAHIDNECEGMLYFRNR